MKLIDTERYKRHISLEEIGLEGQKKLQNASVVIIGVGGLGSAISLYLTAAGIGKIGLVDDDVVSMPNLQRQILYSENEIATSKVECAKQRLEKLNSEVLIETFNLKLNESNAKQILGNYDIVVDGTDNFQARYLLNDTCIELGKPYVYGAINEFSGQVSVFNFNCNDGKKATYRDLYPNENEFKELKLNNGVLGVLPGIIGCMEANEVIKIITGAGEVLSSKVFFIDLLTMKSNIFDI